MRRCRLVFILVGACYLGAVGCGKARSGGHGSGASGGNPTQTRLLKAKLEAAEALHLFDGQFLQEGTRADVSAFITAHAAELADDIEQSPHGWVQGQSVCAQTVLTRNALIEFDIAFCSEQILDSSDAFKLIVHESVHHFGVADEILPDLLAIAVFEADQNRKIHSISPAPSEAPAPTADNGDLKKPGIVIRPEKPCPEPMTIFIPSTGKFENTPTPMCIYPRVEQYERVLSAEFDEAKLAVIVGAEPMDETLGEDLVVEPIDKFNVRITAKAKDMPVDASVSSCEPVQLVVTLKLRCQQQ